MARVSIDDALESEDKFWNLLDIIKQEPLSIRDAALGILVRLFRLAQERWAHGKVITDEDIVDYKLQPVFKSGWLVKIDGGWMVRNPEEYFNWYKQKVDASTAGGIARQAGAQRDIKGRYITANPAGNEPDTSRDQPASSALAPALAPAPVKKKKNKTVSAEADFPVLVQIWNKNCGDQMVRVRSCTPDRIEQAEKRWSENPSEEYWVEIINLMKKSDFCTGKVDPPEGRRRFRGNFGFLVQKGTPDKVLDGLYNENYRSSPKTVKLDLGDSTL